MKIKWETTDIKGGIRVVRRKDNAEIWMIGYVSSNMNEIYCLVSLEDGLITHEYHVEKLVDVLNEGDYRPYNINLNCI